MKKFLLIGLIFGQSCVSDDSKKNSKLDKEMEKHAKIHVTINTPKEMSSSPLKFWSIQYECKKKDGERYANTLNEITVNKMKFSEGDVCKFRLNDIHFEKTSYKRETLRDKWDNKETSALFGNKTTNHGSYLKVENMAEEISDSNKNEIIYKFNEVISGDHFKNEIEKAKKQDNE